MQCHALHYLNYVEMGERRVFFESTLSDKFVAFTDESIFERVLLNSFTADLFLKASSFKGFAGAFNLLHNCKLDFIDKQFERNCLNEVRINQAWFYLYYLKVHVEINKKMPEFAPLMKDLNTAIRNELKPKLLRYFIQKWTGEIYS